MSLILRGSLAAFFNFGYLGYIWTHSWTWPSGIVFAIWVAPVSFLFPEESRFTLFVVVLAAFQLGLLFAVLIVNSSLLPPLVPRLAYVISTRTVGNSRTDTDLEGSIRVETFTRQFKTISGGIQLATGILVLLDVFGDNLSETQKWIYGIAGIVLGVTFLIYGFYKLLTSELRADRTDARYIIFLYLFVLLPPLAYNGMLQLISPFHIVFLWLVLIVLTISVTLAEISWIGVKPGMPAILLEGDPRFIRRERYPVRIAQRWFLVTMLPTLIVYTAMWAAETFGADDTETDDVLLVVSIVVGIMAAISLCFHGLSSPTRANSMYEDQTDEDNTDDNNTNDDDNDADYQRQQKQRRSIETGIKPRRHKRDIGVHLKK